VLKARNGDGVAMDVLIRRYTDKIETGGRGGMNEVRLRFEH